MRGPVVRTHRIHIHIILLVMLCAGASSLWSIGIRYGLPNQQRFDSVDVDEATWLTGIAKMNPSSLDLDPKMHHQPHAYFYIYAAALKAADALGVVTLKPDKEFYHHDVAERAKLYLVGRWLQIAFGVLCIPLVFVMGRELDSTGTGLLAAFFFAIAPGTVGVAHFTQANMPVTLFALLALWASMRVMRRGNRFWSPLAGAAAGLAISTKYSAVPILPVVVCAHAFHTNRLRGAISRNAWMSYSAAAAAFVAGTPYAILKAPSYFAQLFGPFATSITPMGTPIHDPLWMRLLFPVTLALTPGIGAVMLVVSVLGIIAAARTPCREWQLLIIWTALFYCSSIAVGRIAAPGRLHVVIPSLCLTAAFWLHKHFAPWWGKITGVAVTLNACLLTGILVGHYASNDLVQMRAARWMDAHLPAGSSIAIMRPHWYTPDNILYCIDHPDQPDARSHIVQLRYNYSRLLRERPQYLLLSQDELTNVPASYPGSEDFVRRIRAREHYSLLKAFPFDLRLGPLRVFPQLPWSRFDIVWTQTVYLYVRNDLFQSETHRIS